MVAQKGKSVSSDRYLADPTTHPNWKLLDTRQCGLSQSDRIIGGKQAILGSYPWIARIGYSGASKKPPLFRCGGVLINPLYVVTAAHCVTNLPNGLEVAAIRLGEHDTRTDPDCENGVCAEPLQDFLPAEVWVHENYGKPAYKNDIALIRLNRSANFNRELATHHWKHLWNLSNRKIHSANIHRELATHRRKHLRNLSNRKTHAANYNHYVMPICMSYGKLLTKDFVGQPTEVAGWGVYDIDNPKPSRILQTVRLNVVDNEKCAKMFEMYAEIGPTQMCVGGTVGKDSCGGDSGGPLMKVEAVDGPAKYYLIGVVSFGAKRCGGSTMPGVYTRLSSYIPWILENMAP